MTQTDRVLELLRERGESGLTPVEALRLVGTFRLAARIADAKSRIRDGEVIVTERITDHDSGKTFARYILRARPETGQGSLGL